MLNPDFPSKYLSGFYTINKKYYCVIYSGNKQYYNVPNATHRFAPMYTHLILQTLKHLGIKLEDWNNKKVLDICCGNGFLSYHLLKLNPTLKMTLLDINKAELENAKINLNKIEFKYEPTFVDVNFNEKKIESEYDIVVGSSFLHHFPDVGNTIKQIHNMVKIGGVFVSFYEPTLAAIGWEKFNPKLALNAAFGGNDYLENLRTNSQTPLQTTDVWVFTIDDLQKLFNMGGFIEIQTLPKSIAYVLQHGKREFIEGDDEQRLQITKENIEIDWKLIGKVPNELFGACAMSGIRSSDTSVNHEDIEYDNDNNGGVKLSLANFKKQILEANNKITFYDQTELNKLIKSFTKCTFSKSSRFIKWFLMIIFPYNSCRRRIAGKIYHKFKNLFNSSPSV